MADSERLADTDEEVTELAWDYCQKMRARTGAKPVLAEYLDKLPEPKRKRAFQSLILFDEFVGTMVDIDAQLKLDESLGELRKKREGGEQR